MEQELKPGKRIVSKREYIKARSNRLYLNAISLGCVILCFCCVFMYLMMFVACMALVVRILVDPSNFVVYTMGLGVVRFLAVGLRPVWDWLEDLADTYRDYAKQVEDVMVVTRANTGDLPAPESLVRAFAEPIRAQAAILLRAAAQGQQAPAEQLVRPTGG